MKKQLLASAVAFAFATGAFAAEVTIYGDIDTGVVYSHTKMGSAKATNTFKMQSGISSASRWGIMGTEDLGGGYSVSFDLQSDMNSDDGSLGQNGRLFGREARLTLAGPFGELSFGRMGSFTSAAGKYDLFMRKADVYDGGSTAAIAGSNFFYDHTRCDNMVTYATPSLAGFKGYAQYSFKVDSTVTAGTEGKNSSKRYAGVGLTYENGPFSAVAVFDSIMNPTADTVAKKDSRTLSLGGSYNTDAFKVFVGYQYGRNENYAGGYVTTNLQETLGSDWKNTQVKGHNFHVGGSIPAFGGLWTVGTYYTTAKSVEDADVKLKSYDLATTYMYHLSKRTYLFAGMGYLEIKLKSAERSHKTKVFDVTAGVHHTF